MLFRSESEAIYAEWPDTSGGALLSVNNGRIEVRRFDPTRHSIDAEVRTLKAELSRARKRIAELESMRRAGAAEGDLAAPSPTPAAPFRRRRG